MNRHLHILGFSRTGTTMFLTLLRETLNDFHVDHTERTLALVLKASGNNVSKRPMDMMNYDLMMHLKEESKKDVRFFLMQRDIRDVITSIHHDVPGQYFTGYDFTYHVYGHNQFLPIEPGIGDQLRGYRKFKEDDNVVKIHYETLVNYPDSVQHHLAHIFGLDFKMYFSDSSVVISKTQVGRWKQEKHRERIRYQFTKFPELFDILIEDGYEQDVSWFNQL